MGEEIIIEMIDMIIIVIKEEIEIIMKEGEHFLEVEGEIEEEEDTINYSLISYLLNNENISFILFLFNLIIIFSMCY